MITGITSKWHSHHSKLRSRDVWQTWAAVRSLLAAPVSFPFSNRKPRHVTPGAWLLADGQTPPVPPQGCCVESCVPSAQSSHPPQYLFPQQESSPSSWSKFLRIFFFKACQCLLARKQCFFFSCLSVTYFVIACSPESRCMHLNTAGLGVPLEHLRGPAVPCALQNDSGHQAQGWANPDIHGVTLGCQGWWSWLWALQIGTTLQFAPSAPSVPPEEQSEEADSMQQSSDSSSSPACTQRELKREEMVKHSDKKLRWLEA